MSNGASSISTSKKIALTVLGALALLTFVNLMQADANKSRNETEVAVDEAVVTDRTEDIRGRVERKHINRVMTDAGELMIEQRFDVSEGEKISISVGDADINVSTHAENEVAVEVLLEGENMERAREYFDDQHYEVTREGGVVYIRTQPVERNYAWNRGGNAHITVKVAVPSVFNAELKTSDGDVVLGQLEGEVSIRTSDGDIRTGSVTGPSYAVRTSDGDIHSQSIAAREVSITTSDGDIMLEDASGDDVTFRTSDGDIRVRRLEGRAAISTSDGDLFLSSYSGPSLALRTSDGDIVAEEIRAGESQVSTSDGDVMLKSVSGSLSAKTSGGDLSVTIVEAGDEVYIASGDGTIRVAVPQDIAADLLLRGERVRLSSSFRFDGQLKEDLAEGRINGGGVRIQVRSSGGEVVFREN